MKDYLDSILQEGARQHQAGNLRDAEVAYREVLRREPENADALHLLGVLAGQAGQLQPAVELVEKAVRIRPTFHEAFSNLGRLFADLGSFDKSVRAYKRVISLRPNDAVARYVLGLVYRRWDKKDDARTAFLDALKIDPNYAAPFNELAKLDRLDHNADKAIALCKEAIRLQPNFADAYHTLGNALLDMHLSDDGIGQLQRAVDLSPQTAVFHSSLGDAFCRRDRFAEAIAKYNAALTIEPTLAVARHGMAVALCGLGRYSEAITFHKHTIELDPLNSHFHQSYGDTLLAAAEFEAAQPLFLRSIELESTRGASWCGLGVALRQLGKFKEAADCFHKALELNPDDASAYKNLASISNAPSEEEITRLTNILSRSDLAEDDRISAAFGLGKLLDDANRFDEAFHWYEIANSTYRERCSRDGVRFDSDVLHSQVTQLIQDFTPEFFQQRRGWGSPTDIPVFIVGMPRSGTTLTEQIAASHSAVFGAGELPAFKNILLEMPFRGPPSSWDRQAIERAASTQAERLQALGGSAIRVIDKMPGNILNLGLIALMFPNARVILCERDPRDNCLSCYFQWFKKNSLMFCYDLKDCASQYLEQKRLTAHWTQALPLQMLTMRYEDLVDDLEGNSRRLIEFLGLPWEPACLEFHKTDRAVATASFWQVRQPLYNRSVGRWRHYERHLGLLFDCLKSC
jgi:tetratricopeptide (TPR) repeat protein